MSYENIFSERFKTVRSEKRFTQKQVSELLGVEETLIGHWEKKRRLPSFAVFCQISDLFGVSLDFLAGKTDDRRPRKPRKPE